MEEVQLNKNISIAVRQLNWEQGYRKHSFLTVKIQTLSNTVKVCGSYSEAHTLCGSESLTAASPETHTAGRGGDEEEALSRKSQEQN